MARRFAWIVCALALSTCSALAGMQMTFYALTPDEATQLNPEKISALLERADPTQTLALDKAWHGIHFLLTGTGEPSADIRSKVIFGGREIGEDLGYGPARLLAPADIKRIAKMLKSEPAEKLRARYSPAKMDKLGIYPDIWTKEGDAALEYLVGYYLQLSVFFERSAACGSAVVVVLI